LTTIAVNTRLHWQAQQRGREPYQSAPVEFAFDIDLGGDASTEDKKRLIEAAAQGCFVEQSLKPGVVNHRLKVGDGWLAL
jgi:uncharacterized OsmC-like protein